MWGENTCFWPALCDQISVSRSEKDFFIRSAIPENSSLNILFCSSKRLGFSNTRIIVAIMLLFN